MSMPKDLYKVEKHAYEKCAPKVRKETCTVFAWRYTVKSLCLNWHHSQLAQDTGAEDREEVQRLPLWSISKYLHLQMDCHLPAYFITE